MVIVDLSKPEIYQQAHIAGAVHMDYGTIVRIEPPRFGLIPDEQQFSAVLEKAGISPDSYVVAYDDEGGGKAARLLWTLMLAGHQKMAMIDGGLHSWTSEQLPLTNEVTEVSAGRYPVEYSGMHFSADRQYILDKLNDDQVVLFDARSPAEYIGSDVRTTHGGHIPGAINFDWANGMEKENGLRLHPAPYLLDVLESINITPDKEVIVYCNSHHRSAFSFVMLLAIGFEKVRGYPGSWSDWGNCDDTPIEK